MSARSSPRILFLKEEYTFHFSNFLIIGLSNLFANCRMPSQTLVTQAKSKGDCFKIILLLIAPTEGFLSKKKNQPLKQFQVDIHHVLDFWQYQMVYHLIHYQKLFF